MAKESIVDFFKAAQTEIDSQSSGSAAAGSARSAVAAVSRAEAERAYVELAGPVVKVLSDTAQLPEGELFKRTDAPDLSRFRIALDEMQSRGLLRMVAKPTPGSDPIYALA